MKKKFFFLILIISNLISNYDVTLVGRIMQADGLIRQPIWFMEFLKDDLKINFIPSGLVNLVEVPKIVQEIIKEPKIPGKVGFLLDSISSITSCPANHMPRKCLIKLAYSVHETSKLPSGWVATLNKKFDAVIVPDKYLVKLYKNENIEIPIFELPWGLYLEKFLNKPVKPAFNYKRTFIFGMSASFWFRKNFETLIDAFALEFGNSENVELRLHSRFGWDISEKSVMAKIEQHNLKNLTFNKGILSEDEYVDFLNSLDCYVLLSKGEGYSIGPREAMALGIPCIMTNNTAHGAICNTGFVKTIKSMRLEPAIDHKNYFGSFCGFIYSCSINEVRKALREVYKNYNFYLDKAKYGRIWTKQFLYPALKNKFINLIKPKKIVLGNKNIITDNYLMTNSKKLYDKYVQIICN